MNARLDATERRDDLRESAFPFIELVLAFTIWFLAIIFGGSIFSSGNGDTPQFLLVVYVFVIQLPLLLYYERTLGFTGRRTHQYGRVIPWLFNPKVVYGIFIVLFFALIVYSAGDTLESGITALFVGVLLFVYLPVVILFVTVVKWVRNILIHFSSLISEHPASSSDAQRERTPSVSHTDATHGHRQQAARAVRLSGLIVVPLALGWAVSSPELGIGLASLLLTSYEILY